MKVIYILDVFPKISETFILNEILAMKNKGISIKVYSFSKTKEEIVHSRVKEVDKVVYYNKFSMLKEIYAHCYWLSIRPCKYFKTLVLSLKISNGIFKLFIKNLYEVILIARDKPDHIHAHFGCKASNMAMLVHLMTGIPYTFTTHRYDIVETPPRNYKIKSKLAKKHITISEYNRRYIINNFGVEESDIEVIHCGIDFSRKYPSSDNKGKNTIISIARLEKHKGLEDLIKASSALKTRNIEFQCLIVGEGSYRPELNMLICDYGLINEVNLLGSKTQDEVLDLLSKARIGVLPSRSEGIPVSLMEAMAMQVPVIGSDVSGVHELIEDGKCGYLVPPGNVDMLVEKIITLLSDENLRDEFIRNGYIKVFDKFNLEHEADKLIKIWKK